MGSLLAVRRTSALTVLALLFLTFPCSLKAATLPDSQGTDFWLTFPENYQGTGTLTLFIASTTGATGTVSIPGLGYSAPFTVPPGGLTSVVLPVTAMLTLVEGISNQGVHVTSDNDVTVYGLNREQYTTDAYLGLPTDILGTRYRILSYKAGFYASQLAVVATQNATSVTIVPSVAAGARPAGIPFVVTLNQGETYQLQSADPAGLTGTLVTSNQPIGVFGSHQCANVPVGFSACDHIVEEMPPVTSWGNAFVTMPLATRLAGDTFVMVADQDGTVITINGVAQAPLNAGQFLETVLTGPSVITSNNPILVAQYSNSTTFDNVTSDPFMMLIPPYEQFQASYIISAPSSGFSQNFVNVVTDTAGVGSTLLDGVLIPAGSFVPIGTTGFFGVQVPITPGNHALSGPVPFGVSVYGFDMFDSYGYPGGASLAAIASVQTLTLTPPTAVRLIGASHCVTAFVADTNGDPVVGIRVDFTVTGPNAGTGFGYTNAAGEAEFCFLGNNQGTDAIQARVGTLTANATVDWYIITPTATATMTVTPTPTVTLTPTPTITMTPTCLALVWPNPYNPVFAYGGTLKIDCLPLGSEVSIYTVSGELVRKVNWMVPGGMAMGTNMAQWDGQNQKGVPASPGLYYYAVVKGGKVIAKGKFLLAR